MISRTIDAIVSALNELNTTSELGLRSVKEHAGAFTWQEFQNRSYNAPAAFVTNLGWRSLSEKEDHKVHDSADLYAARFAIAIVTKNNQNAELRNRQGRLLCEHICAYLENNNFGLARVSDAFNIKVDPRFMAKVSEDGQALWLIEWWHHLPMLPTELTALDDFEGADIDHANPQNDSQILAETTVNLTTTS